MLLLGEENCMLDTEPVVNDNLDNQDTKRGKSESKTGSKENKKTKKQQKQGFISIFEDAFGKMFSDEDE